MLYALGVSIEINEQFKRALELIEDTGKNAFITGKAGTGKSTLLEYFREHTKKKIVVLAPTGVAAVNVRGETIHSFFKFKTDITPSKVKKKKIAEGSPNIYKELDTIIIDEISMVRADLLDCVEKFLRLNGKNRAKPFGGTQMIFIGDLYQLPPVVTSRERALFRSHYKSEYFFDAKIFEELEMEYLELEKIYRQKDQGFIRLLNSIRNNTITASEIIELNQRYDPHFRSDDHVCLTAVNQAAAEINSVRLNSLKGKLYTFEASMRGDFKEKSSPAETELKLKKGARVMMLNNDSLGRWVNGTMAEVVGIDEEEALISVRLPSGEVEIVGKNKWEMFHFKLNAKANRIETESAGTFIQFPLKLAWAITIHKSQGKTFDNVIIDVGSGTFATGQMYVALSRCRTLEGIVLKRELKKSHVFVDWRIIDFVTRYQYKISNDACPLDEKIGIIQEAIDSDQLLEIVYLKRQDTRTKRVVRPLEVGAMEYGGKSYIGMTAHCSQRQEPRTFRVDRILEMRVREETLEDLME